MGRKIDELRRERRLTKDELAEQLGVCRATVYAWINGRYCPSRSIQPRVARVLRTTVADLNVWASS